MDNVDQSKAVTWHRHADVAQLEAATWLSSLSSLIFGLCASCPQFAPKPAFIPKLYPDKPLIESQLLINLF
jgi:hypothetical protein